MKAFSMHAIRNILQEKWRAAEKGGKHYAQYLRALEADGGKQSGKQIAFIRAAEALSHELELMGVKSLTGAVPLGVLLAEMGGHWALQWLICAPWIHKKWNESSNCKTVTISAGSKICVRFSRRHGLRLAIISALYALKEWPDGNYAYWGQKFLEEEFKGDAGEAYAHLLAIYEGDKEYFMPNPAIEELIAAVNPEAAVGNGSAAS